MADQTIPGAVTTPAIDAETLTPADFVLGLPKAELHLHLEGSVDPATLIELRARHGMKSDPAEIQRIYHYTDFTGFLLAFKEIVGHLRTPEDYELITYRLMQRLKSENVLHAEVYVAVGVNDWRGDLFDGIFEGIDRGRRRGEQDFGVSLYWLFDAVRHFGPAAGQCVFDKALKFRDRGVVGIGIGGDERRAAPELFAESYRWAKQHGLRRVAHAGESTGPESIWGALKSLDAERIGHGLSAIRDAQLVRYLAERRVPVEINITSNLRTACCPALLEHPVRRLFDAGVLVTLNSDDPAMFRTTLAREYQLAHEAFGFSYQELRTLAMNSFRASFLPDERKREYLRLFED